MHWRKFGRIFAFENSPFASRFVSHAQSPQAIVFDDFVRVYFSTRTSDQKGKFLSHIQYVDFDKSFRNILGHSEHEVIALGRLGCFDEHGIFPINVLKDGNVIRAYTTGWNRKVSVSADASIGYAESTDGGHTFQKYGDGPILTASLHEPFLVCDGFVQRFGGMYYMFYIFGQRWCAPTEEHAPERVYKISYATSANGIDWNKSNQLIIPDHLDENECQALPSVLEINGVYHMYFCYRHMTGFRNDPDKGYRLGYAYSNDLSHWTRDDTKGGLALSASGWDSTMQCYPHIFAMDNEVYLLYNGNAFGKAGFGLARLTGV